MLLLLQAANSGSDTEGNSAGGFDLQVPEEKKAIAENATVTMDDTDEDMDFS